MLPKSGLVPFTVQGMPARGPVEQVLVESMPRAVMIREASEAARTAIRYLEEVGALDDPRTHDAFLASGLLAEC